MKQTSFKLAADKALWSIAGIVILIEIIMTFARCFFGVETTDESYYLANAMMVLQGKVPIATMWTFQGGSVLSYAWLIGLYRLFVPELTGVFLFTRLAFTMVRLLVAVYGFFALKKYLGALPALCASFALFPFYGVIDNFSYNTVSSLCISLAGFLAVRAVLDSGPSLRWCLIGILTAYGVYSHPSSAILVPFFGLVFLLLLPDNRARLQSILHYIGGMALCTASVLVWTVIQSGGIHPLLSSLTRMLTSEPQNARPDKLQTILAAISALRWEMRAFVAVAVLSALLCLAAKLVKRPVSRAGVCIFAVCLWLGAGLLLVLQRGFSASTTYQLGILMGLASLLLFLGIEKDRYTTAFFLLLSCPHILFSISVGLTTGAELYSRFYVMLPAVVGLIAMLAHATKRCSDLPVLANGLSLFSLIIAASFLLTADYTYIYRDEPISMLTQQVNGGIYSGLYTTPDNASALPAVESRIREETASCGTVLAMDCAPEVYLMTNASALTPTTWDNIHYGDGKSDPSIMYEYFESIHDTPDMIVYLTSPHKPLQSILDPAFPFNEFVNNGYVQTLQESFGEAYDLIIYQRK